MRGVADARDTYYRSFWSIFSPAFLNPSAVFVAAFFNFRSTLSTICLSSIFFAVLEKPCSILLPTFLAVSSIRSTTLRSPVGCARSASAAELEARQIGRNSQMASHICRRNCIAHLQSHVNHTTNQLTCSDGGGACPDASGTLEDKQKIRRRTKGARERRRIMASSTRSERIIYLRAGATPVPCTWNINPFPTGVQNHRSETMTSANRVLPDLCNADV